MVILPQNVLTIHRVYVLTNLKQSTCTTLNKVYTMYSVYRQPNSQREWKYLTDVSTSTSVKFFSLEESRWDFVDPCIHWMVQLNLTLTEISYSIYPNDQVITNISIDSAVEPISSKRSNVFKLSGYSDMTMVHVESVQFSLLNYDWNQRLELLPWAQHRLLVPRGPPSVRR